MGLHKRNRNIAMAEIERIDMLPLEANPESLAFHLGLLLITFYDCDGTTDDAQKDLTKAAFRKRMLDILEANKWLMCRMEPRKDKKMEIVLDPVYFNPEDYVTEAVVIVWQSVWSLTS